MKKLDITQTILGIIMLILSIGAVLIFIGMFLFLPVAGGTTPSIFDMIVNLFN